MGKRKELLKHTKKIIHLYNKNLSPRKIGELYNCTAQAIHRILNISGVEKRSFSQAAISKNISTSIILNMYKSGLSAIEIGRKLNYSHSLVLKRIHANNIKVRHFKEYNIRYDVLKRSKDIIKLYQSKNLTPIEIAIKLKTNVNLIRKILKTNNIILRDKKKDTKPERIVENILRKFKIQYIKQYKIRNPKTKHFYKFDFYIKELNLLIEIQGDFWHANPKVFNRKKLKSKIQIKCIIKDKHKRKIALDNNYNVIYFWEYDIINNEELVRKILNDICRYGL